MKTVQKIGIWILIIASLWLIVRGITLITWVRADDAKVSDREQYQNLKSNYAWYEFDNMASVKWMAETKGKIESFRNKQFSGFTQ